jgi:1-acyl-sn-glycerol-3-phosphate acyltransferase
MRSLQTPELGATTPRRGNGFSKAAGRLFLWLLGWRFEGGAPEVDRAVLIVAPHTSNWDFVIGVAAMFALGIRVAFLGKHSLFFWPLGPVMRWLGGIPVDRRSSRGVVDETVRIFRSRDRVILALSPEGTRSNVGRWKTGFYFIARLAGVPIIPVSFSYSPREVRFGGPFEPTGDLDADLLALGRFFDGAVGRRETTRRR